MAEEHPPSPARKGVLVAQGIAGQARNDGLKQVLAFIGLLSNNPPHSVLW